MNLNRFIISSNHLLALLTEAKKAIAKNGVVPIIENFLISVQAQELVVTGTDLAKTISIKSCCESKSGTSFECVVPMRLFTFLSKIEDQPITCNFEPETMVFSVITDVDHVDFSSENAKDFPRKPKMEDITQQAELPGAILDEMAMLLDFMHNNEDRKPELCGIHFDDTHGNVLQLTATNGHVLRSTSFDQPYGLSFTVWNHVVSLLATFKSSKKRTIEMINVSATKYNVRFSFREPGYNAEIEIIGKTITEAFPEWSKALPLTFTTEYTGSAGELSKLLTKAESLLAGNSKEIALTFKDDGNLSVDGEDKDFGHKYHGRAYGETKGETIVIGFSIPYLKLCLNKLAEDNFTIKLNSPKKMAILESGKTKMMLAPIDLYTYV